MVMSVYGGERVDDTVFHVYKGKMVCRPWRDEDDEGIYSKCERRNIGYTATVVRSR